MVYQRVVKIYIFFQLFEYTTLKSNLSYILYNPPSLNSTYIDTFHLMFPNFSLLSLQAFSPFVSTLLFVFFLNIPFVNLRLEPKQKTTLFWIEQILLHFKIHSYTIFSISLFPSHPAPANLCMSLYVLFFSNNGTHFCS